jgi:hypothetical protein
MTSPQSQNPTGGGATPQANGADLKSTASTLAEQARVQGQQQIHQARQTTAESIEKIAESARAAAAQLEGDERIGNISQYVAQMADGMAGMATRLRDRNGDEMLHELNRIARENPGLFVAGSIAVGFGLARFARATQASGSPATADASSSTGLSGDGAVTPTADAELSVASGSTLNQETSMDATSGSGGLSGGASQSGHGLGGNSQATGTLTGNATNLGDDRAGFANSTPGGATDVSGGSGDVGTQGRRETGTGTTGMDSGSQGGGARGSGSSPGAPGERGASAGSTSGSGMDESTRGSI